MYFISYFADQIIRYRSLLQYSTEICEASHRPLKDAYYRSNHINAVAQIIRTYIRAHSFVMPKWNIQKWLSKLDHIPKQMCVVIQSTRLSTHLLRNVGRVLTRGKNQGDMCNKTIHNIQTLQMVYELPNLETRTGTYLRRNQLERYYHLNSWIPTSHILWMPRSKHLILFKSQYSHLMTMGTTYPV